MLRAERIRRFQRVSERPFRGVLGARPEVQLPRAAGLLPRRRKTFLKSLGKFLRKEFVLLWAIMGSAAMAASEEAVFEEFDADATTRWTYVQDGVMGGVSQGQARIEDGTLVLTGTVSTANNGGFIQVRQRGFAAWPAAAQGLRLSVKGNGETYYIFLRTPELARVFYSYRAEFEAGARWADVDVPFSSFTPSSDRIPQRFTPDQVTSIGIVAYGRDHEADIRVRSISLY